MSDLLSCQNKGSQRKGIKKEAGCAQRIALVCVMCVSSCV
jgi:hypothetical protein